MNLKQTAAELLERGAEVINERGWVVGVAETEDGVCAYGAIRVAAKEQGIPWQEHLRILKVIDYEVMSHFIDIGFIYKTSDEAPLVQYNDEQAESADQVIDVLKHVAKNIRNTLTPEGEPSASTS